MEVISEFESEVKSSPKIRSQRSVNNSTKQPIKNAVSLKTEYQTQVKYIKEQIGDLEGIRNSLGLSARKMSQLLMVDPSSWNRWSKNKVIPPAHIWRTLQFYYLLQEKWQITPQQMMTVNRGEGLVLQPVNKPDLNLEQSKKINSQLDSLSLEIKKKNLELSDRNQDLENKLESLQLAVRANRASAMMIGAAFLILAFAFYRILIR